MCCVLKSYNQSCRVVSAQFTIRANDELLLAVNVSSASKQMPSLAIICMVEMKREKKTDFDITLTFKCLSHAFTLKSRTITEHYEWDFMISTNIFQKVRNLTCPSSRIMNISSMNVLSVHSPIQAIPNGEAFAAFRIFGCFKQSDAFSIDNFFMLDV